MSTPRSSSGRRASSPGSSSSNLGSSCSAWGATATGPTDGTSSTAASSPEDASKTDHLPRQNGGEEKDDSNADPSIPPESDGGEEKQPTESADTKSDESKPKKPQSSICWSSDEDSDEEKQPMKTSADIKSNEGKLESKSKAATKPISGWGYDDDDSDEDDIATMRKKMAARLAEERKAQR